VPAASVLCRLALARTYSVPERRSDAAWERRNARLRVGCAALLFALLAVGAGALRAADGAGFESVRFQHLGVERGLSQASVRAIAQDRQGFMWFGTQEGLNRFDGYDFQVVLRRAGARDGLPDNHILALAPGPGDGLWVGTQNGGLALFDAYRGRARVWKPGQGVEGGLAAHPVRALLAHRWGGVWVASGEGALQFMADPETPMVSVSTPLGGFGQIRALREAGNGAVLVASSRGVFRVADASAAPEHLGHGWQADVQDVAESFDGSLWVATGDDGLWRIDPEGTAARMLHLREGLPDVELRTLLFDRSGRLWIGSRSGLSRWQLDTGSLQVWRGGAENDWDALSSPRVEALVEDRDGLIWVGTWYAGLNLHDPRTEAFVSARPLPGNPRALPARAVMDVLDDGAGAAWVAFRELGKVVRLDPSGGVMQTLQVPLTDASGAFRGQLRALARTPDGALWMALGEAGLARWSGAGAVEVLAPGGAMQVPVGLVYELAVDDQGALWVGTTGWGLSRLCAGCARFEHWSEREEDAASLPGNEVTAILPTADGSIWIGTRHRGAARLLPDRSGFERYPAEPDSLDGLGHAYVTAFLEAADGTLWLGTQGAGLHRVWRDERGQALRFDRYDRARGLAAEAVGVIQQDRQGRIWLSTTVGLSRLQPDTGSLLNYGPSDGALAQGYFIGSGTKLSGSGRMLFGGPGGLTLFDPDDVQSAPSPSRMAISGVRGLGGEPFGTGSDAPAGRWVRDLGQGDRLLLAPGVDAFGLELTALSYASPEQIRFEYRLEPFEPWRSTDAQRRYISYSHLAPGDYLFLARAQRPTGEASELLSLRVHVPRVWAPMDWLAAVGLSGSLLLGLSLLALGVQRHREQAQARLRVAESEARLKLALWGTGDELWDLDLRRNTLHRENPLPQVRSDSAELVRDADALTRYLHSEDRISARHAISQVVLGDSDVLDFSARVERVGGGYVWLRCRGRVAERDQHGRALRITGTTSDITELKDSAAALENANRELERRVEERTAALSGANRELGEALDTLRRAQGQLVEQEKMAALGGLVAGVAHEINTPVGVGVTAASHLETFTSDFSARAGTGRLTRGDLNEFIEVARESADLILRNLLRADKLIRSFKQVAVDQSNEDRRELDLAEYIDEVLTAWQPQLRRTAHRVECEIPAQLRIETFPGAVYQVISNLIQNALTHAFGDGQRAGLIRICARPEAERLYLEVSDDGVGMEESVRQRVFEPFFTTRRGSGGSGLGLHIVYNLVTQVLGGSIECQASPGAGVRFVIRLPWAGGSPTCAGQDSSG
jgi:signal transduction histidine kinase/ligand-binding sensor domain-containing protein